MIALFKTLEHCLWWWQHCLFILHKSDNEDLDVADVKEANWGEQNISIFFMLWCTFVPSLGIEVKKLEDYSALLQKERLSATVLKEILYTHKKWKPTSPL